MGEAQHCLNQFPSLALAPMQSFISKCVSKSTRPEYTLKMFPICSIIERMNTAFLLMAQYDGAAIIPLEQVRRDYFSHLTVENLLRKVLSRQIKLPIVQMDASSQKSVRGVHLLDLAAYIDRQRASAQSDLEKLNSCK
jgi:hypothetical protein